MSREGKVALYATFLILGVVIVVMLISGCANDARKDLPVSQQNLDESSALVAIMPDGFPNVAHKCVDFGPTTLGIFTTTDRFVILVYNDHACANANREQPQEVINMGSRQAVAGS